MSRHLQGDNPFIRPSFNEPSQNPPRRRTTNMSSFSQNRAQEDSPTTRFINDPQKRELLNNFFDILLDMKDQTPALVEEPLELDEEESIVYPIEPEEKMQKQGADIFEKFEVQVHALDKTLKLFQGKVREFGSSVGLLASASQLRTRLKVVRHLFHENACELFPQHVKTRHRSGIDSLRDKFRTKALQRQLAVVQPVQFTDFPDELENLGQLFKSLLGFLDEFPAFEDEVLEMALEDCYNDIRYRAELLEEFLPEDKGESFATSAMRQYIHHVSVDITEHLSNVDSALSDFIEFGIHGLNVSKNPTGTVNLTTFATFFSAVTATTVQYALDETREGDKERHTNRLPWANLLFLSSLVLSVSAAINSLLGLTWKDALYRSPRHRVPWWIVIWIRRSPIILTVVSVVLFSTGLVLFTYDTQDQSACTTILVLTCVCSFGLISVSSWFAAERWVYSRHEGMKWLADVIEELWEEFMDLRFIYFLKRLPIHIYKFFKKFFKKIDTYLCHRPDTTQHSEDDLLPYTSTISSGVGAPDWGPTSPPANKSFWRFARLMSSPALHQVSSSSSAIIIEGSSEVPLIRGGDSADEKKQPVGDAVVRQHSTGAGSNQRTQELEPFILKQTAEHELGPSLSRSPALEKFASAARRAGRLSSSGTGVARNVAVSTPLPATAGRVEALTPLLRKGTCLEVIDSGNTQANVKTAWLQFSPDGKFLATASLDNKTILWKRSEKAEERYSIHKTLQTINVSQVEWSSDSTLVLTKLRRGIRVWTSEGALVTNIPRHTQVKHVAWNPSGKGFASLEEEEISLIDVETGEVENTVFIERFHVEDMAFASEERMILVGQVTESEWGSKPRLSRAEHRILLYNIEDEEIECRAPFIHEISAIILSKEKEGVLISFKDGSAPQLWRLIGTSLTLRHTYTPPHEIEYAGPCIFGGTDMDELILAPTKQGEVIVWNRESGAYIHSISLRQSPNVFTSHFAWNGAYPPLMLASSSTDGVLRLWESPSFDPNEPAFRDGRLRSGSNTQSRIQENVRDRQRTGMTRQGSRTVNDNPWNLLKTFVGTPVRSQTSNSAV